jgi:GNAT superfamily N-acetyltransferase
VTPDHFPPRANGRGALEFSAANAEVLWRALAAARGHRVIDEPAWLVVDAGNDIGGTRVILRGPVSGPVQRASLNRLVESARRPVVVEDSFATVDLQALGLVPSSLSVMWSGPQTAAALATEERPEITVRPVDGDGPRLLDADRTVVEGFPLSSYQPYQPGRLFPVGLLQMPHISVFVADVMGVPAGACMTVKDAHGVGGVYWVTVLPENRRAGIGRALMLSAMRQLAGMPMVLTATGQGAPVYRKLGFATALESTYWRAALR